MRKALYVGCLILLGNLGVTATGDQTPALKRVMREKLDHAQHLLEATVTADWTALQRHSEALQRITEEPAWMALKTPQYVRHASAFMQATRDLLEAARQRDLETSPVAYMALVASCVQCHRYVARARLADAR